MSMYIIRVAKVTGMMDDLYGASHETNPLRQVVNLASVPGLPRFDLPFAFTIIHGIVRSTKIKTGKAWEHSSRE